MVEPQDKVGNDAADALACVGANEQTVDQSAVRNARLRALVAADVQMMMIDILEARNAAMQEADGAASGGDLVALEVDYSDSDVEIVHEVLVISDDDTANRTPLQQAYEEVQRLPSNFGLHPV